MFLGPRRHGGQEPCPVWPLGDPQCLAGTSLPAHPSERQTLHLPFALGSGGSWRLTYRISSAWTCRGLHDRWADKRQHQGHQASWLWPDYSPGLSGLHIPLQRAVPRGHPCHPGKAPYASRVAALGFLCLCLPSLMNGVFFYNRAKGSSLFFVSPKSNFKHIYSRKLYFKKSVESKKMAQMNLLAGQEQRRRRREQTWWYRKDAKGIKMNWEAETHIYTLPCVKQIASGKLLYSTGSSVLSASSVLWDDPEGWEGGSKQRRYMYTYNWFTLLYSRNQHNIIKQLYSN